ncbi:MAG: 5'-3' exonuclease [Candidatus Nanopelagicales bacterium]
MLMLLDSAGLYFRAFFAVPVSVRAPDGTPVNAVRGFADMLAGLVSQRRPDELVACWDDDWRPQWRVDLVPSYKTHRLVAADSLDEAEPDELSAQVPIIAELLAAVGLTRLGVPGFEADDVIATLAARYAAPERPVEVVTGDRDLLQVVSDHVSVFYVGAGMSKARLFDDAAVFAAHGVHAAQYADYALLRGDPSDGLPGVPGVGAKTAAGLLNSYGDLPGLLNALDRPGTGLRPGVAKALTAHREHLIAAQAVVQAATVPLPANLPLAIPASPAAPQALAELGERWGIANSLRRLSQALWGAVPGTAS